MIDVKKILVTGGARSGKSGFAQDLAYRMSSEGRVLYIATAKVFDWEMEQRVKKHRESRPATWDTYEGYQNLADVIRQKSKAYDVILLDCVTVMLIDSCLITLGSRIRIRFQKSQTEELDRMAKEESSRLIQGIRAADCHVIAVTNELGMAWCRSDFSVEFSGIWPGAPIRRWRKECPMWCLWSVGSLCM